MNTLELFLRHPHAFFVLARDEADTWNFSGGFCIFSHHDPAQIAGWARDLNAASSWCPGCVAVPVVREIVEGTQKRPCYVATGGNDYDGAKQWEEIAR